MQKIDFNDPNCRANLIDEFEGYIRDGKKDKLTYSALCQLYYLNQEYGKSIENGGCALEYDDKDYPSLKYSSMSYFDLGMEEKGVDLAKKAIRSPKRSVPIFLELLLPIVAVMAFILIFPKALLKGKVNGLFHRVKGTIKSDFRDRQWIEWASSRIAKFENDH